MSEEALSAITAEFLARVRNARIDPKETREPWRIASDLLKTEELGVVTHRKVHEHLIDALEEMDKLDEAA